MNEIKESDWKLVRELRPIALERLCGQLLREVGKQCECGERPSYQRFMRVFTVVQDGNDQIARAFDDLRRSTALARVAVMRSNGLITEAEFSRFSEDSRARIGRLQKP